MAAAMSSKGMVENFLEWRMIQVEQQFLAARPGELSFLSEITQREMGPNVPKTNTPLQMSLPLW
jgi:hypothetical protein